MSDICLFLSNDGSVEDRVIDWYTDSSWPHCGWLRQSDMWTFSAEHSGGVAWRPPNPRAKILKLSCDGMDASLSKALTVAGATYDMLDILGIAMSKDWSVPGEFICDKLVFWAQNEIGCPLLNHTFIPLIHLKPQDILLSPYVLEIK